jgi:hypothetical protein
MTARAQTGGGAARGMTLWLLLLSIFAHALVPIGSPLQRTAGSAFSAFTADVSTVPTRRPLREETGARQSAGNSGESGADSGSADAGPLPPSAPAVSARAVGAALPAAAAPPVPLPGGGAASFQARAPPSL